MFVITAGAALIYYFILNETDVTPKVGGSIYHREVWQPSESAFAVWHAPKVIVHPLVEQKFKNIVRQAYDYSCGSAALTTLLNGYTGQNLTEKEVIDGMLKYGEYDRIVARRSFSLLDMKRYVTALGMESGGFKGSPKDLIDLKQPVIVPINYAGFKHFVVLKGIKSGRAFVADPALGNISFSLPRFLEVWDNNTLYMIDKNASNQATNLLALQDVDLSVVEDQIMEMSVMANLVYPNLAIQQQADRASTLVRRQMTNADGTTQTVDIPLRLYYKRK